MYHKAQLLTALQSAVVNQNEYFLSSVARIMDELGNRYHEKRYLESILLTYFSEDLTDKVLSLLK